MHEYIYKILGGDGSFMEEIVRGVALEKPRLNVSYRLTRFDWCIWALKMLAEGAIFICSDECFYEINGGGLRKR